MEVLNNHCDKNVVSHNHSSGTPTPRPVANCTPTEIFIGNPGGIYVDIKGFSEGVSQYITFLYRLLTVHVLIIMR